MKDTPILDHKFYDQPSVFRPENLLREARRQKSITEFDIPEICILDPDGDIEEYVIQKHNAQLNKAWACYHTKLFEFNYGAAKVGIIGKAVGASFAVLLAEQLFASGCKILLSMTSAGQLVQSISPPYFILIEKAVRDEGTSYHYQSISEFSFLKSELKERLDGAFDKLDHCFCLSPHTLYLYGSADWQHGIPNTIVFNHLRACTWDMDTHYHSRILCCYPISRKESKQNNHSRSTGIRVKI